MLTAEVPVGDEILGNFNEGKENVGQEERVIDHCSLTIIH